MRYFIVAHDSSASKQARQPGHGAPPPAFVPPGVVTAVSVVGLAAGCEACPSIQNCRRQLPGEELVDGGFGGDLALLDGVFEVGSAVW